MSGHTVHTVDTALDGPAATWDDPTQVASRCVGAQTEDVEALPSRSAGDEDAHPDPLEDIPREVVENVGAYDTDSAGGCG